MATKPSQTPRPRIQPTAEQLHAAFQRLRRGHWPDSFEAAAADPLLSRLVHMDALRQILQDARTARRADLVRQGRMPWPTGLRTAASTTPDRKRLAAGDTDDDR